MKTRTFWENYDSIKLFCEQANEGFVIVETNSEITKNEFVDLLSGDFSVDFKKLKSFDVQGFRSFGDSIVLVDEFDACSISETVINLNYNRNWFLNLHCVVVFILRSSVVNELIKYSSSFWSFVTLHKIFLDKMSGIIQPHFIIDSKDWFLDGLIKYRAFSSESQQVVSKRKRLCDIVFETLHEMCIYPEIIKLIDQKVSEIDTDNQDAIANLVSNLLVLVERLRGAGFLEEACGCIDYISKTFSISKDYVQLEIKRLKLIAEIKYTNECYDEALETYELLYNKVISNAKNKSINDIVYIASLVNNIGVIYYRKKQYSDALDCYYSAIQSLNNFDENFVSPNILFNLSLLHFQINDYDNALYYIESAVGLLENANTRVEKTLLTKCNVLQAYLHINLGDLNLAKSLLEKSLNFLRNELDENCVFIMEVHYVFSTLYLHKNDLNHAESCAKKAYEIMKSLGCSMQVRAHIRQLLGEIYFYKRDYEKAKYFLTMAYNHSQKRLIFTEDVLGWIKWALKNCDTQ